jgi:hypothetical protein
MKPTGVQSTIARFALMIGFAACGDYAHTNPYEPNASVVITIDGPAVITSRQALVFYSYHAEPAFPSGAKPGWGSEAPSILEPLGTATDGRGEFRAVSNGTATLAVVLGSHVQKRQIVVSLP